MLSEDLYKGQLGSVLVDMPNIDVFVFIQASVNLLDIKSLLSAFLTDMFYHNSILAFG